MKKSNKRAFQDRSWRDLRRLLDGSGGDLGAQHPLRRPPSWSLWGHVGDFWPLRKEQIGRSILGCSWDAFGDDFPSIFVSSWKARSSQKYCFYNSFGTFSGFPDNSSWKASWSYLGTVLPPKTPQVGAKLEPSWEKNRS